MISSFFKLISVKTLWILIIVLTSMLAMTYIDARDKEQQIKQLNDIATKSVEQNKRLSYQNKQLAEEIKNKPVEYITITKDVSKELCNGKVIDSQIRNLPSGGGDEKTRTAGIDDRLPDDLIQLLK